MQNDSGTELTIAVSGAIRSYYAGLGEREWARLTTPLGAIEFAFNSPALGRHLPPCTRVLDIGGGPARYALWLAEQGHLEAIDLLASDGIG